MATIYDVAKRAGVSTATVSAVVNGTTHVSPELTQRVQAAVKALDYTVNELARGVKISATRTVGMLIPDIASPFYARVVRGVEDVLRRERYSLLLGNTYNDVAEQSRYLSVFRAKQADGLLLFVAAGEAEDVRRLVAQKKPVVFVGREPRGFKADTVVADNAEGTSLAIERLIRRGHRHVGLVTGHLSLSTGADRVTGWRRTLRKHRLTADERYVVAGEWTVESGQAAAAQLLALDPAPTAIFAGNFLMMIGVLRAIRARGLASPGDVEVMSSDDSEWLDVFEPRISTVEQPSYALGTQSAELLLKRLREPKRRFERIVLAPSLRERD
jgi:LacI family transcriptional regulator